ncbi:MAG: twin-arginine translocation signal domain-containing protein [Planctomycetaceae bacterium]|nr:twin-arginine translocation signal domain-containing protein [Planctomycetaceae bacterium]
MSHNRQGSTRRDFLRHSATGAAALALLSSIDDYRSVSAQTNERNAAMSKIKGTKTEKNLLKAFAGESQARGRYTMFSAKASEEGYEHIAAIFRETAEQERVHAQRFFEYLDTGEGLEITATYPAGKISTTADNLLAAANGEHEEWEIIYPEFAKIAREEGFADVARSFTAIAVAEKQHEKRYRGFLEHLKAGTLFKRENVVWRCRNCGYVVTGPAAPGVCAACREPQAWFEILAENW